MTIVTKYCVKVGFEAGFKGIPASRLSELLHDMVAEIAEENGEDIDDWSIRNLILAGIQTGASVTSEALQHSLATGTGIDVAINAATAAMIVKAVGSICEMQLS